MSSADRQRWQLIAVLVVGVAVSPFSRWLGLGVFVVVAMLFLRWRRTARGRVVFDREAKTDETRARPDQ